MGDIMKRSTRILTAVILSLSLLFTMEFAVPVMAESEEPVVTVQEDQSGNNDQSQNPDEDQFEIKSNKFTPEQEAAMIRKYGYYHGRNATSIPVLTYHNVVTNKQKRKKPYKKSSLAISKSKFKKQMRYLKKKKYRTINCEEFYLWHEGKISLPPKTVLITFDDGLDGVVKNAFPILRKYRLKGTFFVIGSNVRSGGGGYSSYGTLRWAHSVYPNFEIQSHTYNLHYYYSDTDSYKMVMKDAALQDQLYGFQFHAYPYGRHTNNIVQAYKDSGMKMAFTYGTNRRATRSQDLYKIERIKVSAGISFKRFKKLVKAK